jgi:hypothetical protein
MRLRGLRSRLPESMRWPTFSRRLRLRQQRRVFDRGVARVKLPAHSPRSVSQLHLHVHRPRWAVQSSDVIRNAPSILAMTLAFLDSGEAMRVSALAFAAAGGAERAIQRHDSTTAATLGVISQRKAIIAFDQRFVANHGVIA